MRKAIFFSLMLLALAASVLWVMLRGGEPSVLVLRNTGTNSVRVYYILQPAMGFLFVMIRKRARNTGNMKAGWDFTPRL